MTRRSYATLFLPTAILLALAAALAWMQHTESGAHWIWSHATALVPGELTAGEIKGDLRSGLTLKDLRFANSTTSVKAGTLRLRFDFDLFPPAVSIETLAIDRLDIAQSPAPDQPPSPVPADMLSAFSLPLPLDLPDVRIGQLEYRDTSATTVFASRDLSFSGHWYKGLLIRQAALGTPGTTWQVQGEIGFNPPFTIDATIGSRLKLAGSGTASGMVQAECHLVGTISELHIQAGLDRPDLSIEGDIRGILRQPEWDLRLSAGVLNWPLAGDTPELTLQQVLVHGSGTLSHYQMDAAATVLLKGLPEMPASLYAEGDEKGVRLDRFSLAGEQVRLAAHGPISWVDGLRIELSAEIERLDPGLWLEGWPENQPLNGNLELDWRQDRISVSQLNVATASGDFNLRGHGGLDLAANLVDAELAWDSLRWPPGAGNADISSEHGKLRVQGKPSDWSATGTAHLQAGKWPDGLVTLKGKGNLESARFVIERGEVLGGTFDGEFDYKWAGQQSWSLQARAQNLDVTPLSATFPGVISGAVSAKGSVEPTEFQIDIRQLHGDIRGRSIAANGSILFSAGQLQARDLQVRSGQSSLLLDGSLHSTAGIRFAAHIESLGEFSKDASGSFDGNGRFSINPGQPSLELDLQGQSLSFGQWHIANLSTSQLSGQGEPPATRITLTGLAFGGQNVDTASLTLGGRNPLDTVRLAATREATRLEVAFSGAVNNWSDLDHAAWTGHLESLRVENETMGSVALEEAADVVVGPSHLDFGPACLVGPHNGRVCLDTRWEDGRSFTAHASLDSLSLEVLPVLLDLDLQFSQTLTGNVSWQKLAGAKPTAQVRIESSPGQIIAEGEESGLATSQGLFSFDISDGQLSSGNLDIAFPGAGSIDTDFSAPDISGGIGSAIDGRIRIELNRIDPLVKWIPMPVDQIEGSVNADIRLSGTLAGPRLTGHASLVRGRVEYSSSGTIISDITLAGAVNNYDYTEFNGSFRMGEGRGRIKAALKLDNIMDPDITLQLSGENLALVSVPDMSMTANPDLNLHWHESMLNLDGRIRVPAARISPRYLPSASASESPDLVLTNDKQPKPEPEFFDRSKFKLNGEVSVELGKDVTVTLERATARLRGKVAFNWDKNLLPVADGSYTLSGKIFSYGQLLEVSEGRVSFPHVAADNPHLNIRAEREIYGNLQVKQAGVLVTGTLKRPVLEPYTTPATSRERALTLLVTGHDFDYEQGVGGVELGMYIAPRLYVSYGIGLFETQSVISARYDLKKGFGIKATSGQRETGVDISYTIEH